MAVAPAPAGGQLPPIPEDNLADMSRYKLNPPFYNGDCSTFEEWKYKFTAYMGLQDNDYTALLQAAETANAELTEAQLRGTATTIEDGERHVRLSTDLRYILINTTTGAAATVCRQHQHTQSALKCTDNYAYALQSHSEQDPLDTSQDYSNPNSTTTSSRSPLQHGSLNYKGLKETMGSNSPMQ